jgi:hypothetical protein
MRGPDDPAELGDQGLRGGGHALLRSEESGQTRTSTRGRVVSREFVSDGGVGTKSENGGRVGIIVRASSEHDRPLAVCRCVAAPGIGAILILGSER